MGFPRPNGSAAYTSRTNVSREENEENTCDKRAICYTDGVRQ